MIRFGLGQIIGLLALLLLVPASAGAKTRADCDKIDNPMLFNECLASLAPERQPRARRAGRPPDDAEEPRGGRRAAKRRPADDPVKRVGGGRKRIEFTVR